MVSRSALLALVALLAVGLAPVSARQLLDADEVEKAALLPNGGYKNDKPLIGILTQSCHYCPGRWVWVWGYVGGLGSVSRGPRKGSRADGPGFGPRVAFRTRR